MCVFGFWIVWLVFVFVGEVWLWLVDEIVGDVYCILVGYYLLVQWWFMGYCWWYVVFDEIGCFVQVCYVGVDVEIVVVLQWWEGDVIIGVVLVFVVVVVVGGILYGVQCLVMVWIWGQCVVDGFFIGGSYFCICWYRVVQLCYVVEYCVYLW